MKNFFDMGSGYVLNFSDSTIGQFFADILEIDIHDQKYQTVGSSKAKKVRAFWTAEPDHLVGKAITALIDHLENNGSTPQNQNSSPRAGLSPLAC